MVVIPAIDLVGGKCVRLYQGDYERQRTYGEDPLGQALKFRAARFSRLHMIDLEGARSGSGQNRQAIRKVARALDLPVQAGGGIRTSEDVSELFGWGVKYLILGTVALKEPEKVTEWVKGWGAERFIVSLDFKAGKLVSEGWLETSSVTLEEALARIQGWGIRQIICTDTEKDGTLEQPNYWTYEKMLKQLSSDAGLIAAGGVCRPEHVRRLKGMGVQGAVIGRALYEGEISWEELIHAG
ncbi:MAG: 1-(5-phosphoribosyl)-5-[(5-phosphoribosylamino)methylideneamino]imidazole-4-carboxamide isomerase [Acidobacteriota bacterium]